MKLKFLLSLLVAGTLAAGAQSQGYKDGIEYYKAGQYENARTILNRNLNNQETDQSLANYYLGQVALVQGDKVSAKSYFDKGLSLNPENAYNYVGLGALQLLDGNVSAAQDNFKKAQSLAKKNAEISVAIARAYYNADPVKYAKELGKALDKARKDSKNTEPSIYILEGDMAADAKEYNKAAEWYEQAINFDQNNPEGYVKYAKVYFYVNPKFAIEKLEQLYQMQPNSALAQRELAKTYYDGKYWGKAADLYGKYIQNPNHFPEDKALYSVLLYWAEKYPESLRVANEILAQDPSNFLMQRMRFLNQNATGDYQNAADNAKAFFEDNPDAKFTINDYTTYAEALTNLGQDSLAVVQYEIAVNKNPDNADLLKSLSDIYTKNKQYLEAAEAYDAYLQLQEQPSVNDLFGLTGRYLNVAATSQDNDQRVKAADRGIEYMNKIMEKANPQAPLYQRLARLYVARNGNKPDENAIDAYTRMTELLNQDAANMAADNRASLNLYKEAYSFGMLYYSSIAPDKEKLAEATQNFNTVNALLNPETAAPDAE